jgi:hypothetical protein
MEEAALALAVVQLAGVMQAVTDADLARPWAWKAYEGEGIRFGMFRTMEELRELAVRLEMQRAAGNVPLTAAQRIFGQYHAAYRDLQAVMLGLTPQEMELPPAEGEWAAHKVLQHMIGADLGFSVSIRYGLQQHRAGTWKLEEMPGAARRLTGMMDEQIEAVLAGPLAGLQAFHQELHQTILQELSSYTDAELELGSMYWEPEPMSIRFRMGRFESHLRQHTVQMEKTLAGIGRAPNEARCLLRLIYAALAEVEASLIGDWDLGQAEREELAKTIRDRSREFKKILEG